MSSSMSSQAPKNVHLVVLVHGLWGNPRHLAVAHEELQQAYERASEKARQEGDLDTVPEMQAIVAQGNEGTHTYDGIDVCAGRVAKEIEREVRRIEKDGSRVVRDFSIMGYSVGGLIARYVIAILETRDPSFFVKHQPINFTTLASPHVGIMKYRGRFWQWVAVQYGYRLLGRTGDQLYTWDTFSASDDRPLLEVMSDPEGIFIQALNRFQRIDFFVNAVQDHTVTYPTGAINYDDPFVETPAKSSVTEEVVVETDEAGIIQRWYTVPIQDGVKKGNKPTPPTISRNPSSAVTTFARRPEISRALSSNRRRPKRMRLDAKRKQAPFLPPFLVFPRPFNWIFYALTPVFMPVFMVGVVVAFFIDSGRSRRRAEAVSRNEPLNEAIATAVAAVRQSPDGSGGDSDSDGSVPEPSDVRHFSMQTAGSMNMVRMRLNTAARSLSNGMMRRTTGFSPESGGESDDDEGPIRLDNRRVEFSCNEDDSRRSSSAESTQSEFTLVDESPVGGDDGLGSILGHIKDWTRGDSIRSQGNFAARTNPAPQGSVPSAQQRSVSPPQDRTQYTDSEPKPYPHPAHDPDASPQRPDLTEKKDVKLQLTDVQRRIIRNLNEGIDPTRWRKWLTWLPMVGNAHAAIVVRDGIKFPEQEHGRGIVRRWAENTIMHADRKA